MRRKSHPPVIEERLAAAAREAEEARYKLVLYVVGATPKSARAIANIKQICEEHLQGRYDLEVIDLYKEPALAAKEQIVAAPTLVKKLPPPIRKLVGDLSNMDEIILGLDLKEQA